MVKKRKTRVDFVIKKIEHNVVNYNEAMNNTRVIYHYELVMYPMNYYVPQGSARSDNIF